MDRAETHSLTHKSMVFICMMTDQRGQMLKAEMTSPCQCSYLACSMEQGLSCEANGSSASHTFYILWEWKVHKCVYCSLPVVPILNYIIPFHAYANFDSIKVSGYGLYQYIYWIELDHHIITYNSKMFVGHISWYLYHFVFVSIYDIMYTVSTHGCNYILKVGMRVVFLPKIQNHESVKICTCTLYCQQLAT